MLRFLPDVAVHIRDFLKVVDVTEEGTKASEYIDVLQRPIHKLSIIDTYETQSKHFKPSIRATRFRFGLNLIWGDFDSRK